MLGSPVFLGTHRPDLIISAGRPGLSRLQTMLFTSAAVTVLDRPAGPEASPQTRPPARHIVVAKQPGRWDDP